MRQFLAGLACACVLLVARASDVQQQSAAVSAERLVHGDLEPQNWLTPGGGYSEQRYSALKGINDTNVGKLHLAWYYDLDTNRGQEATPVVVDGVMYSTSAWSKVQAFEAGTGRLLWQFDPKVPGVSAIHECCDMVNRGVAVWKGRIYVGTVDGRLIALNAGSGNVLWSIVTTDPKLPYTITGAPLAVAGRILIGNAGGEYGVRGYVSAYDATTGKLLWRFYTVPADPAKGFENEAMARAAKTWTGQWWKNGGGGTVWNSLSYDPELDLVYFGTGNAAPWGRSTESGPPGDNLYTASILALHAADGAYAWHYQTTPGDAWDYDADQTLSLATLNLGGRPRKVLMQANKNGFFYVLDRATGELLSAKNFVPVNWASGVDLRSGRPQVVPQARYAGTGGVWVGAPGALGGHNWEPASFSPDTGLVYIPAQELPFPYKKDSEFSRVKLGVNLAIDLAATSLPQDPKSKQQAFAGLKGYLLAWDPIGQREVWRVTYPGPWNGGVLTTAGNLAFQGTAAGEFVAYRASDGRRLWSFAAQTGVIAAPMTYAIAGKQYLTVLAGWGGAFPLLAGELSFKSGRVVNRSRVLTFTLDGTQQLPAAQPPVTEKRAPPSVPVDAALAAAGAKQYAKRCTSCHGDAAVSGGLVPDLRYSLGLSNDAFWKAVVEDGALAGGGMIGFKSDASHRQLDSVRAFLIQRAQQSAAAKHAAQGLAR